MSKPLNAKQLRIIESYRDNTSLTPETVAAQTQFPIADVRRIYAEKRA